MGVHPIPGKFVVNIGKALDSVRPGTRYLALCPLPQSGDPATPRYSIPFASIPAEIPKFKGGRGEIVTTIAVNFLEIYQLPSGQVGAHWKSQICFFRVIYISLLLTAGRNHPDIAQKHHPAL